MYSLLRNEEKLENTILHCDKFEWIKNKIKKKLHLKFLNLKKKKIEYFYGMHLKVNVKKKYFKEQGSKTTE
jgi:hypothetical protein